MIAAVGKFFDCESILHGEFDPAYGNDRFMHDIACRYTEIVKKDTSTLADPSN